MKTLLLSFVVVISSCLTPAYAYAEILEDKTAICAAANSGRKGAWLDTEALKKCLTADMAVENLTLQLGTAAEQKVILLKDIDMLKASLDTATQQSTVFQDQLDAKDKVVNNLSHDLQVWYRNPFVVGALGFVLGAITVTAVVVAAN